MGEVERWKGWARVKAWRDQRRAYLF